MVTAEVPTITVISGIWYHLRPVQRPRPATNRAAGDAWVGFGRLYADDVGTGTVTMQTPVRQIATRAGCKSSARWALRTN